MRSALRTRAGPKARYADCGSLAGATLDTCGRARGRLQVAVDRAVRVARARAAVGALGVRGPGARAARAVGGARARRAALPQTQSGAAQRRAALERDLAGRGAARRAVVALRAPAERADRRRAL